MQRSTATRTNGYAGIQRVASYCDLAFAAAKVFQRVDHIIDLRRAKTWINTDPESAIDDRIRVGEAPRDTEITALHIWLPHQIAAEQQARANVPGLQLQQQTVSIDRRSLAKSAQNRTMTALCRR